MFERARQLAGTNSTFNQYIEEQYNAFLLKVGVLGVPLPRSSCQSWHHPQVL